MRLDSPLRLLRDYDGKGKTRDSDEDTTDQAKWQGSDNALFLVSSICYHVNSDAINTRKSEFLLAARHVSCVCVSCVCLFVMTEWERMA